MSKAEDMIAASRLKAQAAFTRTKQGDAKRIEAREKERQAEDAKTARLRELRLAKEAADRANQQTARPRPARRKPRADASG